VLLFLIFARLGINIAISSSSNIVVDSSSSSSSLILCYIFIHLYQHVMVVDSSRLAVRSIVIY
jgi:hypothetical protein